MTVDAISAALLAWYDVHARDLPWRARPGEPSPEPYRVWLSEIMLQQTTTAAVAPYFAAFTARWPNVDALAAADDADVMAAWAGLGYYARARNLLAAARVVAARGGRFPDDEAGLRALPGVGKYTAAAIAAIAFGRRATVVDGNVERVVARLFALVDKSLVRERAGALTPTARPGDHAQATMDLGATICTPRTPKCRLCPVGGWCVARGADAVERYPVKVAKRVRPVRHGTMFWVTCRGWVRVVRRESTGLLGGMRALPTGPWTDVAPGLAGAPVDADWRWLPGVARHGFTHFELVLRVAAAEVDTRDAGEWWPVDALDEAGLPTLFARAARLALRESAAASIAEA